MALPVFLAAQADLGVQRIDDQHCGYAISVTALTTSQFRVLMAENGATWSRPPQPARAPHPAGTLSARR
jgi:hypothetical protein